jgi:hypothetical protein
MVTTPDGSDDGKGGFESAQRGKSFWWGTVFALWLGVLFGLVICGAEYHSFDTYRCMYACHITHIEFLLVVLIFARHGKPPSTASSKSYDGWL